MCELYNRYLRENRKDPAGDAMYDARKKIWQDRYLPSSLELPGMSMFKEMDKTLHARYYFESENRWMQPDDPPIYKGNTAGYGEGSNAQGLAVWRDRDSCSYASRGLKSAKYNDAQWEQYCAQMDEWYERLVVESLISWGVINVNKKPREKWINMRIVDSIKKSSTFSNNVRMCKKQYEQIVEKHKDELPMLLEKEKEKRRQRFENKNKS